MPSKADRERTASEQWIQETLEHRSRPRLLDLFCGAGGATRGYQLAGFHVTGVDLSPQPNYCGEVFHQADALTFPLEGFDAIHASPPCQAYSVTRKAWNGREDHPDLVSPVRKRLEAAGLPYIIENVVGAPLRNPIQLCGSSFGLDVRRHRLFESNVPMWASPCAHHLQRVGRFPALRSGRETLATVVGVFGTGGGAAKDISLWREAMGIDWMATKGELAESIPPAFTEYLGRQLIARLHTAA
ncbi:MAG TPA: DNA methylase [Gemmatimonadota bacterium]|nr:DNA methylase [Gemmatimonadota bacterium]